MEEGVRRRGGEGRRAKGRWILKEKREGVSCWSLLGKYPNLS